MVFEIGNVLFASLRLQQILGIDKRQYVIEILAMAASEKPHGSWTSKGRGFDSNLRKSSQEQW